MQVPAALGVLVAEQGQQPPTKSPSSYAVGPSPKPSPASLPLAHQKTRAEPAKEEKPTSPLQSILEQKEGDEAATNPSSDSSRQIRRKRSHQDFRGAIEPSSLRVTIDGVVERKRRSSTPAQVSVPLSPPKLLKHSSAGHPMTLTASLGGPRPSAHEVRASSPLTQIYPPLSSPTDTVVPPPSPSTTSPRVRPSMTSAPGSLRVPSGLGAPSVSSGHRDDVSKRLSVVERKPKASSSVSMCDQRTWSTALASSVGSVPWTRIRQSFVEYDSASDGGSGSSGSESGESDDEKVATKASRKAERDLVASVAAVHPQGFLTSTGGKVVIAREADCTPIRMLMDKSGKVRESSVGCLPSRSPSRSKNPFGQQRKVPSPQNPPSPPHSTATPSSNVTPEQNHQQTRKKSMNKMAKQQSKQTLCVATPPSQPNIISPAVTLEITPTPHLPYSIWNGDQHLLEPLPHRNPYIKDLHSDPEAFPYPRGSDEFNFPIEDDARRKNFFPVGGLGKKSGETSELPYVLPREAAQRKGIKEWARPVGLGVGKACRGLSRIIWRHPDWTALLVGLVFSLVSAVVVWVMFEEMDRAQASRDFGIVGDNIASAFVRSMASLVTAYPLQAAALMVASNGTLTRQAFLESMTAASVTSPTSPLGVAWAPLVSSEGDRLAWEASGFPFLSVNETLDALTTIPPFLPSPIPPPLSTTPEYLPLQYLFSSAEESFVNPGYDLLTDSKYGSRSRAVTNARNSGNITFTGRLKPLRIITNSTTLTNSTSITYPSTAPVFMAVVPVFALPIPATSPSAIPLPAVTTTTTALPTETSIPISYPRNIFNGGPANLTLMQTPGLWGVMASTFSPTPLLTRAVADTLVSMSPTSSNTFLTFGST
ncbi:hypothetical protein BC829DRAFT_45900 [Chytridium lagenaria]|nr:hypothetical protein BC829DRAFT_45900 [Chytridium lagenaria]